MKVILIISVEIASNVYKAEKLALPAKEIYQANVSKNNQKKYQVCTKELKIYLYSLCNFIGMKYILKLSYYEFILQFYIYVDLKLSEFTIYS